MTESAYSPGAGRPERAFLDANVIRGQQTNDIMLSLADEGVFEPRWTQHVIDEMRRNRPPGVSETAIDRRISLMNRAFEDAMTEVPPQQLQDQMQADPKDKHVLAGAVHSQSDVLVTNNLKDFDPPTTGPNAMRVESVNQFLSRKLEENPEQVRAGLQTMLDRSRRDPRTMSALIDTMAEGRELQEFAQNLNAAVPPDQRGSSPALTENVQQAGSELRTDSALGTAQHAALDGVAQPGKVRAPTSTPEARKSAGQSQSTERTKDPDQGK
ncbi:hypothetical protein GCM10009804_39530 [Kribbella hippodromi]|uniref:PIN domain-containing protein n=1 Tax=Kribbella hippodromi TaxID=434347 RepID=A0ABP4PEE1_9ACTN